VTTRTPRAAEVHASATASGTSEGSASKHSAVLQSQSAVASSSGSEDGNPKQELVAFGLIAVELAVIAWLCRRLFKTMEQTERILRENDKKETK